MKTTPRSLLSIVSTALAVFAGGTAAAATQTADARATYQAEMAQCRSGATPQDRRTCIAEAKAAYAQNLRGGLADRNADYERNNRLRCEALSGLERSACVARMQGQGITRGSVDSGGIYRELVVPSDEPPAEKK